ncbi:MAG TPA: hypothetical protein DCR40_22055 [Prolixibacteraceae bacterium]|nr:hypothetical protein [Prolixibacteraceae bacterium]
MPKYQAVKILTIERVFAQSDGCEKNPVEEESRPTPDGLTIEQAKSFVEDQRLSQFTLKSGDLQKKTINIKADWDKAKSSNNEKVSVIETEILAQGRFGFATAESMDAWKATNSKSYIHSMSRLVVIQEKKTGEMYSFIMSVVGGKSYFEGKKFNLWDNTYLKRDKDLTGYVLFHNLSGEFVNGWIYCDGEITNSIAEPENLDLSVQLKSATTMQSIYMWVEECTYLWTIVGGPGLTSTYSEQLVGCQDILVFVGYYDYGSTSGGGGGTSGGYIPGTNQPCNCPDICPVCGKCIVEVTLKNAPLPGESGTTNTITCPKCNCPPRNPIPTISSLTSGFNVVAKMSAEDVYSFIGGNALINYQSNRTAFRNACALRLSYTLNMISGYEIPFVEGQTISGDVNKDGTKEWYFYRVSDMVNYLNGIFGSCTLTDTNSINGMTGIIWQSDCGWDDASGHIDIWNSNNALGHYYDGCSVVYIWRN